MKTDAILNEIKTYMSKINLQAETTNSGEQEEQSISALEVFYKWYALYKSTFYLLTYLQREKTDMLRSIGKQSGESVESVQETKWWAMVVQVLKWNDPRWRSLLHFLFVAKTCGKVRLWLWKSLENWDFFSYIVATLHWTVERDVCSCLARCWRAVWQRISTERSTNKWHDWDRQTHNSAALPHYSYSTSSSPRPQWRRRFIHRISSCENLIVNIMSTFSSC